MNFKAWEVKHFFPPGCLYQSEKNKRGQIICGLEKDNSQCSMFTLPPYWAAHEPVDMVVWCWIENKNPPQQTEGWNRETGTERQGRKGRTIDRWTLLWLKMAAVFTADYEGLYSIHRKAVGVVCDSAQQNQEPHSGVNRQVWCLLLNLGGWKLRLDATFHSIVYRSIMSVIVFHASAIPVL